MKIFNKVAQASCLCVLIFALNVRAEDEIVVKIPAITIPTVTIPTVEIPVIVIPSVTIVTAITTEELAALVDVPEVLLNFIVIPNASIPDMDIPSADVPVVADAGEGVKAGLTKIQDGLAKEATFQATDHPQNFVTDKRTVAYMKDASSSNPVWKAWKAVYAKDYAPIAYVSVADIAGIKMICEMKAVKTQAEKDNLYAELTYFKTLGYNAVLAVWEGEATYGLSEQINAVKALGFKVFFAYGTREKLEDKIFIDPVKYAQGLATLAGQCDGYLVGWRRTSLHLFKADNKFVAYSINAVRQGNPTIPIFGEIYRGYAGSKNKDGSENMNKFCVNIPTNASGAFVVNFGYQGVRPDGVLNLVRTSTDVPLVVLVVGERPYYLTQNDNHKSKAENRKIIDNIEKRFVASGFGVATLAGDGSNEIYRKDVSDDLCKSQWSK